LILPTQAEYFSSHALRSMMSLVRQVRSQYNPRLTYRVLITMLDLRNRIHRIILDQLKNSFESGLFETIIQIDTKLRESAVVGLPITHFANQTRSAHQYRALALEIAQNVRQSVAQPAR
jgi:chromosome partitioning protein